MSVQPLKTGQKFMKIEGGQKPIEKKVKPVPNSIPKSTHTYYREPNGNIDVDVFMDKLVKRLSKTNINRGANIYDDSGIAPIEVDIKKEIYINKLDENQVTVDKVVEGKVNNKLDKLRALRNKK